MTISDLLGLVFVLTRSIEHIYLPRGAWPLDGVIGSITCKFRHYAADISLAVSVLTLEVITLERFSSVVFPMKRQPIQSNKTCLIVIALIRLIGAVYPSSNIYSAKLIHEGTTPYCSYNWGPAFDHAEADKVDVLIFLVAFAIIAFLLLTSLYSTHLPLPTEDKPPFGPPSDTTQSQGKQTNNVHVGNSCCCLFGDVAATKHLCIP